MAEAQGVLVLGDSAENELSSISRELLAAGRRLADDLSEELAIGLLGDTLDQPSQQAIIHGADKVYAVNHPNLGRVPGRAIPRCHGSPRQGRLPQGHVLIGRTTQGRELAPRLAFRLGVGLGAGLLGSVGGPGLQDPVRQPPGVRGQRRRRGQLQLHPANRRHPAQGLRTDGTRRLPPRPGRVLPGGTGLDPSQKQGR